MARGPNIKPLRARYAGKYPVPKPASIDEQSWAMFTAYFQEGLTLREIGANARVSPSRVCRVLYEVDAQLASARRAGPEGEPVVLESPIEDLALSSRARNALRSRGCNSVQDVLRLDLSGPVRGIGRKTRGEVLAALRNSGLPHPELDEPLDPDFRILDRSLERIRGRIGAALEDVTNEIAAVQKRLRKRMETRNGGATDGVTPA